MPQLFQFFIYFHSISKFGDQHRWGPNSILEVGWSLHSLLAPMTPPVAGAPEVTIPLCSSYRVRFVSSSSKSLCLGRRIRPSGFRSDLNCL